MEKVCTSGNILLCHSNLIDAVVPVYAIQFSVVLFNFEPQYLENIAKYRGDIKIGADNTMSIFFLTNWFDFSQKSINHM